MIMDTEKTEARGRCLKCLLQEYDEAAYISKLKRVILMMKASERASDEETNRRLLLCKQCDYLEKGTCLACGCYVELRAAMRHGRCPYSKWTDRR